MWTINNDTPFQAKGAIRLDPITSRTVWLVAIKATFDICDDHTLTLSRHPIEVLDTPVYRGKEGSRSLIYDSDLMGLKPRIDIILNASAYQPNNIAGTELEVGFFIDHWGKTLRIVGNRLWDRFLGTMVKTYAQPFTQKPIVYELAYGGIDEKAKPERQNHYHNPVGTGYAVKKSRLTGKYLPNIEYTDWPTKSGFKRNRCAGFGAIPNHWKPRIDYAGSYDKDWQESRSPYFPSDFNPLFFQSAPTDQQYDMLLGGEKVTLIHLMPEKSDYHFYIPRLRFELSTRFNSSLKRHKAEIKTLIIEPDDRRLILVWQSQLDCHGKDYQPKETTIQAKTEDLALLAAIQRHQQHDAPSDEIEN